MELKVDSYELPQNIQFNFEELKNELSDKVHIYETIVYDEDQIKQAKTDKANLNKLKKALNDERIRREKEYMKPFNEFKEKINEIISIIDKPVALIDTQVKDYENKRKAEKEEAVKEIWESKEKPEWLTLEAAYNLHSEWRNLSTSMKSIEDSIDLLIEQVNKDLSTLSILPEFGFEATEVYKTSLDLNFALNEGRRISEMQKRKANEQAKVEIKTEPVEEKKEKKVWVNFSAELSNSDALLLKQFFNNHNIKFKSI